MRQGLVAAEGFPISEDAMYGPQMTFQLAQTYALAGRPDDALDQMELLLEIPSGFTAHDFAGNPAFGGLVDHPRFRSLRERYEPKG